MQKLHLLCVRVCMCVYVYVCVVDKCVKECIKIRSK